MYQIEDLTITVCTIERPRYLAVALDSLAATTPAGATLQVVFNGTSDDSIEHVRSRIEAWDGPTRVIELPDTVSLDQSHNKALGSVETPLVNFMGDDDVVLAPRLPRILARFGELTPTPAVVSSFARRIGSDVDRLVLGSNKDLGPVSVAEWRSWVDRGRMFELLWPGAVIRTDALHDAGGFEPEFALTADNRLFTAMAQRAPVVVVPERSFGYRIHSEAVSTSRFLEQARHVRHVQACLDAVRAGRPEPSFEEFCEAEAEAPAWQRARAGLHDRSRRRFRRAGAEWLDGRRRAAAADFGVALGLYPPAFAGKVADQLGRPWALGG